MQLGTRIHRFRLGQARPPAVRIPEPPAIGLRFRESEKYRQGFKDGWRAGYSSGFNAGWIEGYQKGRSGVEATIPGLQKQARQAGYNAGLADCRREEVPEARKRGFKQGRAQGRSEGLAECRGTEIPVARQAGFKNGIAQGISETRRLEVPKARKGGFEAGRNDVLSKVVPKAKEEAYKKGRIEGIEKCEGEIVSAAPVELRAMTKGELINEVTRLREMTFGGKVAAWAAGAAGAVGGLLLSRK